MPAIDLSRLDKSHVASALFAGKSPRNWQMTICNETLSTEEEGWLPGIAALDMPIIRTISKTH